MSIDAGHLHKIRTAASPQCVSGPVGFTLSRYMLFDALHFSAADVDAESPLHEADMGWFDLLQRVEAVRLVASRLRRLTGRVTVLWEAK